MRRFHFLLFFSLSSFITVAQDQLTSSQLIEDFDIFESSIRTIHPRLHWYLDSTTVDERLEQIKSGLDQEQSLQTFYTSLLGFYANIGCGHSWLSMPSTLRKQWETGPYLMPFYLYNTGDLWYVTTIYQRKNYQCRLN